MMNSEARKKHQEQQTFVDEVEVRLAIGDEIYPLLFDNHSCTHNLAPLITWILERDARIRGEAGEEIDQATTGHVPLPGQATVVQQARAVVEQMIMDGDFERLLLDRDRRLGR